MHEPDFWSGYADAMELSIEGNRLIAREIAQAAQGFWKWMIQSFDAALRSVGQHPHLPPV
jgi:hypothetical protein